MEKVDMDTMNSILNTVVIETATDIHFKLTWRRNHVSMTSYLNFVKKKKKKKKKKKETMEYRVGNNGARKGRKIAK